MSSDGVRPGPIAWMVRNHVTANLLMLALIVGGLLTSLRIKQEVFPDFDVDVISISVPYPGASPEEVERGIVLAVEEAVRGVDGVKEVRSTAREGSARIEVEVLSGADHQRVLQDVKQGVDRITTLPDDAEEPQVSLQMHRRRVMTVTLYGDVEERVLRELTEEVRDRFLSDPQITQVDLSAARDVEVAVEISQETLRTYGLTLEQVASIIRRSALELPAGGVKTGSGEILLRVKERRDLAREFASIPLMTTPTGSELLLGDIASVRDTFEDTDRLQVFDGVRSMSLEVYRIGEQTPIGVSDAVRGKIEEVRPDLPPGVDLVVNVDMSKIYRQRLELLLRNGFLGLCIVLVVLGLFLELRLAFWVTVGIPTSFLGAMLFLPMFDISINMISMFAFIIALGIVVDDAIVAGENIYEYRQRGTSFGKAAILGARDVAVPISFSILTNIVAFMPLAMVPGFFGKIFRVIPLVVTSAFVISWVEALFILPAHLSHRHRGNVVGRLFFRLQQRFSDAFLGFVRRVYGPLLAGCLRLRYVTVAVGFAVLIGILGYVASGRLGFVLMPRVESDRTVASAVLPYGSPMARAEEVRDRLIVAAQSVLDSNGGETLGQGILGTITENQVEVTVYLTEPEIRPISTGEVTRLWREQTGRIKGLESLRFESDRGGPGRGAALTVELAHRDVGVLDEASQRLAAALEEIAYTADVDDGYTPGKAQLDFRLRPEATSLGLTANDVARQIRSAFYGAEALRQQRGRNEITVRVRRPETERVREHDVEELMIRTPAGRDVPLRQVADVERGRAFTSITRRQGRRTVTVTSNVEPQSKSNQVLAQVKAEILPALRKDHPGLTWSFEGHQAEMRESLDGLKAGFLFALLGIYFLLAIPFRSYVQPLIVMISIPFGIVGAVLGHLVMGYSLSVISMMGIVALAGVVVNDSLILVDYANRRRREGLSPHDAVRAAGIRRFRPVLLTTLTTFGGLAPMIFETSRQARFMIPMALSLGFGIVFATVISLVLVPSLYLIAEDALWLLRAVLGSRKQEEEPDPSPA
jgi:multidrug efflux pump subunit AcrB